MTRLILAASALALACAASGPATALSMSECSAKYKAAKDAGTLGNMKWNDFRKSQCGADAEPAAANAPATAPAPAEAAKPAPTAKPAPAAEPSTPAASGTAVFPKAVDPKYANESPGKARMKTCVD